jgi:hypothetical protein
MLPLERKQCSFKVDELMNVMGTAKRRDQTLNAKKIFINTPFEKEFSRTENYMSYKDQFENQVERTADPQPSTSTLNPQPKP